MGGGGGGGDDDDLMPRRERWLVVARGKSLTVILHILRIFLHCRKYIVIGSHHHLKGSKVKQTYSTSCIHTHNFIGNYMLEVIKPSKQPK